MNLKSFCIIFLLVYPIVDVNALLQKDRWWISGEYLHWWVQDSPISVPLATQNASSFAIINQPGTHIIFGKDSPTDSFHFDAIEGLRITMGGWLDSAYHYGIESSAFGFVKPKQTFVASSVGVGKPILDVPFFSIKTSSENVLVGNRPNTITDSDAFQPYSFELNMLDNIADTMNIPLIMSAGFRFMGMREYLVLNDAIYDTPSLPANSVLNIQDRFSTRNHFYGFQVGARTLFSYNQFDFEAIGKIALGVNAQQLQISGETKVNSTKILQPIGIFAEPTNIGTFNQHLFAVLPEFQVKLGYHFNHSMYPFISYNVLCINHAIRASNEIDRNINLTQNPLIGGSGILSGTAAPLKQFNETSLWMQGISIGLHINLN